MKKLSLYIFLVLMFCNLANTSKAEENLYKINIDGMKRLNGEKISNLLANKKINFYHKDGNGGHYYAEETHSLNGDFYQNSKVLAEVTGEWKVQDNTLCYKYDEHGPIGEWKKEWEADKEFVCDIYIYSKNNNYYFVNNEEEIYAKIIFK